MTKDNPKNRYPNKPNTKLNDVYIPGLPLILCNLMILSLPFYKYFEWSKNMRNHQLTILGRILTAPGLALGYIGKKTIGAFLYLIKDFLKLSYFCREKFGSLKSGNDSWLIEQKNND